MAGSKHCIIFNTTTQRWNPTVRLTGWIFSPSDMLPTKLPYELFPLTMSGVGVQGGRAWTSAPMSPRGAGLDGSRGGLAARILPRCQWAGAICRSDETQEARVGK